MACLMINEDKAPRLATLYRSPLSKPSIPMFIDASILYLACQAFLKVLDNKGLKWPDLKPCTLLLLKNPLNPGYNDAIVPLERTV